MLLQKLVIVCDRDPMALELRLPIPHPTPCTPQPLLRPLRLALTFVLSLIEMEASSVCPSVSGLFPLHTNSSKQDIQTASRYTKR